MKAKVIFLLTLPNFLLDFYLRLAGKDIYPTKLSNHNNTKRTTSAFNIIFILASIGIRALIAHKAKPIMTSIIIIDSMTSV